jgi:hypothetical protein
VESGDAAQRFCVAQLRRFGRISLDLPSIAIFEAERFKTTGFSLLARMDLMYSINLLECRDALW